MSAAEIAALLALFFQLGLGALALVTVYRVIEDL